MRTINITVKDQERLKKLIKEELAKDLKNKSVVGLSGEVERAVAVSPGEVPPGVITMNSRVLIEIDGVQKEITLVYPVDAKLWENKISVLSPIGTALLGYAEGDEIEWQVPTGVSKIFIRKLLYQPEAAGDYEL